MGLKLKIGLAALAVAAMLSGCASGPSSTSALSPRWSELGYRQYVQSLVGQSTDELQIEFGEPYSVKDLPDGRKQWFYERIFESVSPGEVSTHSDVDVETYTDENGKRKVRSVFRDVPVYNPATVMRYVCSTDFIVGPDNKVVSYHFDGHPCARPENSKPAG